MSIRYPSTVYSSDPALTKGGVPHPAPNSTPHPHISTTTCYPSTLPNNPSAILYVADAPITPEAVGSFYFEVRVEELLPAPRRGRTTSSTTTGRVSAPPHLAEVEEVASSVNDEEDDDDDDIDINQTDGPINPPPLSDKPLTFIVGLTSDRLKMMTTMSTPGLAPGSIGYFNHQQMIYRCGGGVGIGEAGGGIPHDDADDSENYGDVATNDKIEDCDRTFVDEFVVDNGPDQRMRLGRVACVGCLVDYTNSTIRFTKNGTAMPVAALLGHNRHRLTQSPSSAGTTTTPMPPMIPPGHARRYPLNSTTASLSPGQLLSARPPPSIYPVVSIPRNCGSQYLIHFTFMTPSSLSTHHHAAPLCRFPYSAWVHNEGEKAMRRQMASQTSKYVEEEGGVGGHTHMLEMIMAHFTLRGMHDVVGTLQREVKAVEGGCPSSPSSSPVPGMASPGGASSSNTSCGATPIRISTDGPDCATSPHHSTTPTTVPSPSDTAAALQAAYNHIEKDTPLKALHIIKRTGLSHLLPPATDIHPPPLTGTHFLSKRWDVVYWITLLQVITDVSVGSEREGWAQILVGAFDEVDKSAGGGALTSLSSLADQAMPHAYPPPDRHTRLAAVNTILQLIASRSVNSRGREGSDKAEGDDADQMLAAARHRVRLRTIAALDTFLHDVRQQWSRIHDDDVHVRHQCSEEEEDDPHAPSVSNNTTANVVVSLTSPSPCATTTASSLRALVEDLRANVSLNAMSVSCPINDRPTTSNPLLPNYNNRSATHVYARSIAERLGAARWEGSSEGSGSVNAMIASASRGGEKGPTLPVHPDTNLSPVSSQWMSCSDSDDNDEDLEWDMDASNTITTTLQQQHPHGTTNPQVSSYYDILTTFIQEHLP